MGRNDALDDFDFEDDYDDFYFDGDDLDEDLLYALFDADEYETWDEDE